MYHRHLRVNLLLLAAVAPSVGYSISLSQCPALLKRAGLRLIVKDRKLPLVFGSSAVFVKPAGKRNLIQSVALHMQRPLFRESARTDHTLSLIDGPIAKATLHRYGVQKELTLGAAIVPISLRAALTGLVLHALFPETILDPIVWTSKKESIKSEIGVELNHDDLEYYLRQHPDFWDLHKEFLEAKKRDPATSMTPYLKRVRERMDELVLAHEELAQLSPVGEAANIEDYRAVQIAAADPNFNAAALEKLSPTQRNILLRFSYAHQLAANENEAPYPLRQLSRTLQNMFATVEAIGSGAILASSGMQATPEWTSDFAKSPQALAKMDFAMVRAMGQFTNQYWQMDIHINPAQRAKWIAAAPLYNQAIDKLLSEEKPLHDQIQNIHSKIRHEFFFQSALKEYTGARLNLEWQQELGIMHSDPEMRDATGVMGQLQRQLEQRKQMTVSGAR